MTYYNLSDDPNQRFIIDYNGKAITVSLRYSPTIEAWLAGIDGVCSSIRVVVNVPIFQQFGFNRLFFIQQDNGEITRSLENTMLLYVDEGDLNDEDFPTAEVFLNQVRVRRNG